MTLFFNCIKRSRFGELSDKIQTILKMQPQLQDSSKPLFEWRKDERKNN